MKILNQRYEAACEISKLIPHPENPHEGDIGAIVAGIGSLGFYGAVIAQVSTSYVLAGNHRMMAALEQGALTVPVIWLDVSDADARKILLSDNRISALGTDNAELLSELLNSIVTAEGSLDGTGYGADDLTAIMESLNGSPIFESANAAKAKEKKPNPDKQSAASGIDPASAPGDAASISTPNYDVIVICRDAEEQRTAFERMTADGWICRVG